LHRLHLHSRRLLTEREAPPHLDTGDWLREEDLTLLSCFAPDFRDTRHRRQLQVALRRAGYSAAAARHLIRASPLLVRDHSRHYRLADYTAEVPVPPPT
jgi:hypothetical protein